MTTHAPPSAPARLAAVVVTYRREKELKRLLECIAASSRQPDLLVVVDHAASADTEQLCKHTGLRTHYFPDPSNPGPGAGWNNGMIIAHEQFPKTTHYLVLDDDVTLPPDAVESLLDLATTRQAGAVAPLLTDDAGNIWAFPEPEPRHLRKVIRNCQTPDDYIARAGAEPQPFCWCTGACILVDARIAAEAGPYRNDFHILGEDLEFSMRLSARSTCLYAPTIVVPHLPPSPHSQSDATQANLLKFCSLLQNLAYISFHLPHSRHMKSYLPGNAKRFLHTFGTTPQSLRLLARCLANGALLAQPAGAPSGQHLREKVRKR